MEDCISHVHNRTVSTSVRATFRSTLRHSWSWWRAKTFATSTSNAVSNSKYVALACVKLCIILL